MSDPDKALRQVVAERIPGVSRGYLVMHESDGQGGRRVLMSEPSALMIDSDGYVNVMSDDGAISVSPSPDGFVMRQDLGITTAEEDEDDM